ncbi:MAG: hypothetical protein JXQ76_03065, partial [Campylobacterales bacterium]|nr:hypothetical protein [Campylobacterales bacterium]
MSKKLYLHIGTHKTGTTSIQKALANNRNKLNEKGLSYFYDNPDGTKSPIFNTHSWFSLNENFLKDGLTIKFKNKLSQEISKLSEEVIVSSENFSWLFNASELIELKKELEVYFDEIKIIIYLRRQEALTISHRQEGSKNLLRPASMFYGNEVTALPMHQGSFEPYLNYYEKIKMWSSVLGKESIIVRVFDKKVLYQGDAVADFFHLFGIEDIEPVKSNVSSGFEKTKVGLLMNHINMPDGIVRNTIRAYLSNEGKLMPSKEEAMQFYAHYRQSNEALNQEFLISDNHAGIFDEDFSAYPQ